MLLSSLFGVRVELVGLDRADLIAIGSILQQVPASRSRVVHCWGSGLIRSDAAVHIDSLRFAAVRGPLTRERVGAPRSVALGDPALLLPKLMARRSLAPEFRVGIVPHYVDVESEWVQAASDSPEVMVLDVGVETPAFVEQLLQCEVILSSSLHGLIVADAFGIPNGWIQLSENVAGSGFKFADYFASVGRAGAPLMLGSLSAMIRSVLLGYRPLANLDLIQDRLLDSFPKELLR